MEAFIVGFIFPIRIILLGIGENQYFPSYLQNKIRLLYGNAILQLIMFKPFLLNKALS